MKKILILLSMLVMCISLVACGGTDSSNDSKSTSTDISTEKRKEKKNVEYFEECSTLPMPDSVADFSKTGSSKKTTNGVVTEIKYTYSSDKGKTEYEEYINYLKALSFQIKDKGEEGTLVIENKIGIATIKCDETSGFKIEVYIIPEADRVEVPAKEDKKEAKKELTAEELEVQLGEQELKITSTNYLVQDENYKALYPDMLQVILQNNTEYDIKNAVIAFVAWDENNLPVKIKGDMDYSPSYIKQCDYDDINLIPGGTFGDSSGFEVDENCGIKNFKAIIVSYEAFTGEKWENPLYKDWCKLYEGVKLTPELMVD